MRASGTNGRTSTPPSAGAIRTSVPPSQRWSAPSRQRFARSGPNARKRSVESAKSYGSGKRNRATRRSAERQWPRLDGRGMDDRRRRLAEDDEAVEDVLEIVQRAELEPDEEAVVAGDPVALDDLGHLPR